MPANVATSRLEASVRSSDGEINLIPYLMAGYPDHASSIQQGLAYSGAGVAAIEVGIPFRDPLADGPALQRSLYLAGRDPVQTS